MKTPDTIDLSILPKSIRQQVYDFYLLVKQQSEQQSKQPASNTPECALLSENALAKGWLNEAEDEAWRDFQ